jgi:hypothetical protein
VHHARSLAPPGMPPPRKRRGPRFHWLAKKMPACTMSGVLSLLSVGGRRFGVAATRHGGELGSKQGHLGGFTPPGAYLWNVSKRGGSLKVCGIFYLVYCTSQVGGWCTAFGTWSLLVSCRRYLCFFLWVLAGPPFGIQQEGECCWCAVKVRC